MTAPALARDGDLWRLPLVGCTVAQVCVSWLLVVRLEGEQASYELHVEQPFLLTSASEPVLLDPSGEPELLAPFLALVRRSVLNAAAFDNGRLELTVSGGYGIEVRASDEYEAWTLTGSDGLRVVSVPGQKLAVWQPQE